MELKSNFSASVFQCKTNILQNILNRFLRIDSHNFISECIFHIFK